MAIAVTNSASGSVGNTVGTITLSSFTISGSDMILLVAANDQANSGANWSTNVPGITCNGTSLTKIGVRYVDSGPYGNNTSLWGLLAPTTGNVVATRTSKGDGFMIGAASYSGVDQGTAISSLANNGISNGTFSTPQASPAVTVPTDGWAVMSTYISIGSPAATAGSGTYLRQTVSGAEYGYLFDTNAAVSGSTSLNVARTTTAKYGMVICAIGPVSSPSGPTNLKSLDSNLKANIKSYNGNLIANIKSIDGNS